MRASKPKRRDGRFEAQHRVDALFDEEAHLAAISSSRRRSTLFTTRTIFLPQSDQLQVLALDSVKGLSEEVREDEVRAGHEAAAELLVVADDGVGSRRVDDGDLAQEVVRISLSRTPSRRSRSAVVPVPEDRDPVGRRRTPSRESSSSPTGVYERGLAGVELAHDDEQNNSSRSTSFWRTSETSSDGEPKSSRKPARRSRRARSRSVTRRQRFRICT